MNPLPTGTVTFLFSDIEGSTQLLQRLGPDYRETLERHATIIRQALAANGGREVSTEGDSFFAVFTSAGGAVDAAAAAQTKLAAEPWPDAGAVRVRMGIHTGEAEIGHDNYIGLDVHRAARIGAAGHGGQVLVSAATRQLASAAADYLDLGEHRLKDLEGIEHLYQVIVPGLPRQFPPVRSVGERANNLPASTAAMTGRADESGAIAELLASHRVVTITGPGGVGKTRLALEVARDQVPAFPSGVYFVPLAPITDFHLVLGAVGNAVDVADASVEAIAGELRGGSSLLFLDNFEQVAPAAGDVADLLKASPETKCLVTSQVPLRIGGEHVFRLTPLTTRVAGHAPLESPAALLFIERAKAVDSAFDVASHSSGIVALVELLDGLPLALELAAARVNLMTPDQIVERLQGGIDLLSGGAVDSPDRHRSVRAAIRWSYELLDEPTQSVFRKLSPLRGGMSLEAAEAVAAAAGTDVLASIGELVDRGLLHRSTAGMSAYRLRMLEPVRIFAGDIVLEVGEDEQVRQSHAAYFSHLATLAAPELDKERQPWWLARLEEDLDNIRAALTWYLERGDASSGLGMLGDIWRFFQGKGHLAELELWLERCFALPSAGELTANRVKGLMARAAGRYWKGDAAASIDFYAEAVDIARGLGDDLLLATALYGLASSYIMDRNMDGLGVLEETEAIYKRLDDTGGLAHVAASRAFAHLTDGNVRGSSDLFENALELYEAAGHRVFAGQTALAVAGIALEEGRFDDALVSARRGLQYGEEIGDRFLVAWAVEWVATALVELGDVDRASRLSGAAAAARHRLGGGWTPLMIGVDDSSTRLARLLGDDAAEAARSAGAEVTLEGAAALAKEAP